jgi:hypothetical protein
MPYTRTQANSLLNKAEMTLFDESRANAIRKLDGKALGSRVERTRKLRDKARDQLQRQRLASRSRTGSKRGTSGDANRRSKDKAELLADILKRFEAQSRAAGKQARADAATRKPATRAGGKKTAARKAAARKAAPGRAAATKTAAKKTTAKKTAFKKAAVKKSAAKKTAVNKTAAKKTAAKKTAAKKASPRKTAPATSRAGKSAPEKARTGKAVPAKRARKASKAPISPDQALANTRALLEAKKRHDREGAAWQHLDGAASPPAGRYQSPEARSRAEELHAGESRMTAIEGSISTRDRKNQAKRDKR